MAAPTCTGTRTSAIPVEMCCLGWQESLTLLAQLVEPGMPDSA